MRNVFLCSLFYLFLFSTCVASEDISGFWKTVNEKTHRAESIVAVYEYQGKYYGRIILTFNEQGQVQDTIYKASVRAPGVIGNPYYAGLDIIWDLKPHGKRFTDGEILDPEHGKVYGAELWTQGDNLIVRGKLLIFGRNQTWPKALDSDFPSDFVKPDLAALIPVKPRVR